MRVQGFEHRLPMEYDAGSFQMKLGQRVLIAALVMFYAGLLLVSLVIL